MKSSLRGLYDNTGSRLTLRTLEQVMGQRNVIPLNPRATRRTIGEDMRFYKAMANV